MLCCVNLPHLTQCTQVTIGGLVQRSPAHHLHIPITEHSKVFCGHLSTLLLPGVALQRDQENCRGEAIFDDVNQIQHKRCAAVKSQMSINLEKKSSMCTTAPVVTHREVEKHIAELQGELATSRTVRVAVRRVTVPSEAPTTDPAPEPGISPNA